MILLSIATRIMYDGTYTTDTIPYCMVVKWWWKNPSTILHNKIQQYNLQFKTNIVIWIQLRIKSSQAEKTKDARRRKGGTGIMYAYDMYVEDCTSSLKGSFVDSKFTDQPLPNWLFFTN